MPMPNFYVFLLVSSKLLGAKKKKKYMYIYIYLTTISEEAKEIEGGREGAH